jgi:hypothetical protein
MEATCALYNATDISIHKKKATLIKKVSNALCCPCHVNTSMKKVEGLLVKTLKTLYDKREKHMRWVTVTIKFFFHLSQQCHNHPMKKTCPLNQIYSNGVNNDDISQCANAIIQ